MNEFIASHQLSRSIYRKKSKNDDQDALGMKASAHCGYGGFQETVSQTHHQ